jgi:predicted nucleic acid-binding protein
MQSFIVDTVALVAYFLKNEQHHVASKEFFEQHPHTSWIILETVFAETVTLLRAKTSPKFSIQVGNILRKKAIFLRLSDADEAATWEAFCRYNDKSWSYTDCSILVMAQNLNVFHVVSFDQHIRQMAQLGIICLP